jgi:hypothetical protein
MTVDQAPTKLHGVVASQHPSDVTVTIDCGTAAPRWPQLRSIHGRRVLRSVFDMEALYAPRTPHPDRG